MTLEEYVIADGKASWEPINYRLTHVCNIPCKEKDKYNEIVTQLQSRTDFVKCVRTPSKGISTKGNLKYSNQYFIEWFRWGIEVFIVMYIDRERYSVRYHFGTALRGDEGQKKYSGRKALNRFREDLAKCGINLDDYAIPNGREVKETIEKAMIWVDPLAISYTLENCHHIDFHSSHPAGMMKAFPEFAPTIQHYYDLRKKNAIYKSQLNMLWGALQSISLCGARWAHISKEGIADTNRRLRDIANRLKESGRTLIAFNTDGVWYQGEVYHGEGEGENIGEWHNDHINCTLRYKSRGCYEFIEDGVYYPVVRGYTKLDKEKTRDQWQWGDIYKSDAVVIKFVMNADGTVSETFETEEEYGNNEEIF